MLLLALLACTTEPGEARSPVAGCTMLQQRYAADGDPAPYLERTEAWDAQGNRILADEVFLPTVPDRTAYHRETWAWDGELLVRESERDWTPEFQPAAIVQEHRYEGGLRVETAVLEERDGASEQVGLWTWSHDGDGHRVGGGLDLDGDGEAEVVHEEAWTPLVWGGWHVELEQAEVGQPYSVREVRELDATERLTRLEVDDDGDGILDNVEEWVFDAEGRVATWEQSGAAQLGTSCTYTWQGEDKARAVCWDEVRKDHETTWTYASPGRAVAVEIWRLPDDAPAYLLEVWRQTWDCP